MQFSPILIIPFPAMDVNKTLVCLETYVRLLATHVIRTFLMFFSVALMTSVFAWLFGWFPVDMLEAWGCFFACFGFCSFASAYIMAFKTDRENKQLEEALKKLKEEEEGNA